MERTPIASTPSTSTAHTRRSTLPTPRIATCGWLMTIGAARRLPPTPWFEIAQQLQRVVEAARTGKLAPQDVRGGTFTISNHGVGGSLLAAPIVINQPQVAILGVGKVQRRVCVIDVDGGESIAVRSMCYLTLTIDHRALDAFQANAFLGLVVKTLEQWPDTAEALQD